jgi:hypothetical protein
MLGAIVIVVVLLVLPVVIIMSSAVIASVLGWSLKADAEQSHEGSELIALNR